METKYKAAAKFYGTTCVVLLLMLVGLFIMYFRALSKNNPAESIWKHKYDSLDVLYKNNADRWAKFEKDSKGYYFVNPKDQKIVKGFNLNNFIEK